MRRECWLVFRWDFNSISKAGVHNQQTKCNSRAWKGNTDWWNKIPGVFFLKKSYLKRSSAVSGTLQNYRWISHGKQDTEHGVWKNEDGRKKLHILCRIFGLLFLFWRESPQWAKASSFTRFLDHTQRHITVGRTHLDDWSARCRGLYLTTHTTHNRDIHAPGKIRTHNLSRRAAADLRLRPRSCWDRFMFRSSH